MTRRRTILAIIVYCVIVVMLWLMPVLVWRSGSDAEGIFLWGPRKIAIAMADLRVPGAARDPVVMGIISVGGFGLLGLPVLGAFLVRSSPLLRFTLAFIGALIVLAYFSFGVFGYLFWSRLHLG